MLTTACGWRSGDENIAVNSTDSSSELLTTIPFSNREPDVYQTEIIIKIGDTERKILTARNAARRVMIIDQNEKHEVTLLENAGNPPMMISRTDKSYTELSASVFSGMEEANDFLTNEWLNQKTTATFENLGAENGLTKYLVRLGSEGNQNSEAVIYVDENIKLPVRQEFYSLQNNQRVLTSTIELRNFKLSADENLFQLPEGFRKISAPDFQKLARREKIR